MADQLKEWAGAVPKSYQGIYLKALRGKGSPRAAIKAKCLECCAWNRRDGGRDNIGNCQVRKCPLWAFRPFQTKEGAPLV